MRVGGGRREGGGQSLGKVLVVLAQEQNLEAPTHYSFLSGDFSLSLVDFLFSFSHCLQQRMGMGGGGGKGSEAWVKSMPCSLKRRTWKHQNVFSLPWVIFLSLFPVFALSPWVPVNCHPS